MGNYELRGETSFWEKRTLTWPRLLKYRILKDPDVPPTPCWETGTNQMHKTIYTPGGVNKSPFTFVSFVFALLFRARRNRK